MAEDRELETGFVELLPAMQRCAELAQAGARGRGKKKARVLDALLAEVGAFVRGRHDDPRYGIGEQVSDLAAMGRAPTPKQAAAISALAAYAYALEAAWDVVAGRGTRQKVHEQLAHAREHAAETQGDARPASPALDIAERVRRLVPGDDTELAAVVAIIVQHRLRDLVPEVLERLGLIDDTDAIDHAVRSMQRLYPSPARARSARASDPDLGRRAAARGEFADLCARLCASPNAGTRRWVARALISGLRPAHVPSLLPLLGDPEPKVRREAVNVLRAAAVWHPETRPSIGAALDGALGSFPDDLALLELRSSLSAPPPTTS